MAYSSIVKPSVYFNTKLYTGTGSSNALTGVGFQPDFTWIKSRSDALSHALFDAVRGTTKVLNSNANTAEYTNTDTLTAFGSDGFTVGSNTGVNASGETRVAWNWKANGQGSSNTDGSINTTYTSVSTTSGFSISKYVGTGSAATVGHGLGVVPKMLMIKDLSAATDWTIYHVGVGNTKRLVLNTTGAQEDDASFFNDTSPTSSVFSIGSSSAVNLSGRNYICYAFAEKKGYSKFGSYKGNGAADGTFVYTGFKPAFILQKLITSGSTGWGMFDSTRSPNNVSKNMILANSNAVEDTGNAGAIDFLSNGFKWRTTDSWFNDSNENIFMAFAEEPLVANSGTDGVPATAR